MPPRQERCVPRTSSSTSTATGARCTRSTARFPRREGPGGDLRQVATCSARGHRAALRVAAGLPAAAERLVQRDGLQVDAGLGLGQLVLGGELGALRVQQFEVVGGTGVVTDLRQRGGPFALVRLFDQVLHALALLVETDQRVV